MTNYIEEIVNLLNKPRPQEQEVPEVGTPEDSDGDPLAPLNLDAILAERHSRYGTFIENAFVAQELKEVMHKTQVWEHLDPDQKEALEIIASKISRMLTGDPDYSDSWIDIAGYAQLVADRLEGRIR